MLDENLLGENCGRLQQWVQKQQAGTAGKEEAGTGPRPQVEEGERTSALRGSTWGWDGDWEGRILLLGNRPSPTCANKGEGVRMGDVSSDGLVNACPQRSRNIMRRRKVPRLRLLAVCLWVGALLRHKDGVG